MFAASSPKTPRDSNTLLPPDLSCLSIPNREQASSTRFGSLPPVTPTAREDDNLGAFADRRISITPVNGLSLGDVDLDLRSRFDQVEVVGRGEFSQVYRVTRVSRSAAATLDSNPGTPPTPLEAQVFAVKKTRLPFFGARDREAKLREVIVLRALRGRPHVLQFIESWENQYHLYIQTEYCEEGSLSEFLGIVGAAGRLDDFRIWKILLEASMGLQSIHEAGFIHLDFKPANVLINYEGQLKIGDFGLATPWPAARGIEGEGDRRYIAPEILEARYDKPADVFSLGLVMFEIASNVWLPDNGPVWHALRAGNFAAVPTGPLTGSESDALSRDARGMPVAGDVDAASDTYSLEDEDEDFHLYHHQPRFPSKFMHSPTHNPSNLFGLSKRTQSRRPPAFMVQNEHKGSLDKVVTRMLSPSPTNRPTIQQLLETDSIRWVIANRRAGATVYEGNWGPQVFGGLDADMSDV
ncbi:kinase-like domain-containing protein [Coniella lustricola]|uniref:Kinase-like domain-containing protein n=1 Tax=Coniella lustricola TaxID=2025994 RepID=A0A2T2ZXG3_9PEZI|nr:kinase-like domain-containing protein [Coniella lustricola]